MTFTECQKGGNQMLKRLISLFIVICILFSLSACVTTGKSNTDAVLSGQETNTTQIASEDNKEELNGESSKINTDSTQSQKNQSKPTNTITKPSHTHVFSKATCEHPATCSCGVTQGSALGHSWEGPTKENPKTCSVCKKVDEQDEIKKTWFVNQYNIAKEQHIGELEQERTAKQNEISNLRKSMNDEYAIYQQKILNIYMQYPAGSRTRDTATEIVQANYQGAIKPYQTKITQLQVEISQITKDISEPSVDRVLAIVTKNCGITSLQSYEYYSQYQNCF